ncbi:SRPBCC family protein [Mesorhizobium muleiense]|uniref:SRPBCC family protein n=1 Tax=Mesorhizobium muleiense TaxID=1004279 RepID=UPI001F2B7912|nr:SRPBCC domain-containing protein [Mesorhizobium muleiense]MCF6113375.1 SRPBCC domain-containing protein [Mesorhizobium muleiense]
MKGAKLQIIRRFRASPEKMFAACTDPSLMVRWFGPKDFRVTELEADVRVGGTFSFRMVGPPGEMAAGGEYEVVEPPTLLVHTWRWTDGPVEYPPDGVTSRITYELSADGSGTRLTFTQEGLPTQDQADSHEEGWSEALDKLEAILEPR